MRWVPWTATLAYAAVYSWLGIERYASYHASCDDGLFTQAIAAALRGFSNTPEGASHFAFHFSPILYAVAPLLWAFRSPVVLIVVGSVAGALTIPAIYYIAARRVPPSIAAVVAIVAALYPPLGGVSFTDFSENVFAPAATAWLLWAIDARKMGAAWCFAVVCLCIKEDQALFVAFTALVGAVYFGRRQERRWVVFGLSLAGVSLATLAFFMTIVRHATNVGYGYPSIRDFYGGVSALQLAGGMFTPPKLAYLGGVLVPLLGICLLSEAMVLALPGLAECLLARVPVAYTMGQHYAATWVPYVLVAFALGVARLWRYAPKLAPIAPLAAAALSLYLNVAASPNDWPANLSPRTAEDGVLDRFVAGLPADGSVTSFCQVFAHLGMHPNATVYASVPSDYVVFYGERDSGDWRQRERRYVETSHYRLIERVGSVEIYGR